MDALPAAVYATDAEGRLTHFNRAAAELAGRTPQVGKDRWCITWKLYRPDGTALPPDQCPMAVALRERRSIAGAEAIAERPDGSRIWFAAYPTPIFDANGRMVGGIDMLVDITARKRFELSLARGAREQGALYRFTDALQRARTSDEIHEAALEAILEGMGCDRASVLLLDERGVMRFVASHRLSDAYRAAVEGHSPWPLDAPDPQPIGIRDVAASDLDTDLKATVMGEGIRAIGFVPLTGDGRLIGKFMVYYDVEHQFEAGDQAFALTIARQLALAIDRHSAEDDRQQSSRDLEFLAALSERIRTAADGEQLLDDVSRSIGDYLDVRRTFFIEIDQANDRGFIRRDYCRGAESVAGEYRLSSYSPLTRRQIAAGQTIVNADASVDERTAAQYETGYRPSGERAYVAVPMLADGRWEGTFWVSTDVPRTWEPREVALLETAGERAWNAAEKLRLDAALRLADRRKDEFLATLAHELRNPLGPIRSALPLIESGGSRGDDTSRWVEIVSRQTDRLARLVDDLIDVSRITRGHVELRLESVDIVALVARVVDATAEETEGHDLTVTRTLPDHAVTVEGDPIRLEQVVTNLLSNAIRYTDRGGEVGVTVAVDGDDVEITVADDGIGMEPRFLTDAFTLFEQADRSLDRSHGGLGIGLTLAQQLVELHHGTIKAQSEGLGHGSAFTVRLPRQDGSERSAPPATDGVEAPSSVAPAPRRVLVIDDNVDYAEVLAELISQAGHEVRIAQQAVAGLEMAREFAPDLVLLDIGLPGMSGYELGPILRRDPATADARLVAISGYGQPADRERSAQAGLDDHLVKPIELSALDDLLASPRR